MIFDESDKNSILKLEFYFSRHMPNEQKEYLPLFPDDFELD